MNLHLDVIKRCLPISMAGNGNVTDNLSLFPRDGLLRNRSCRGFRHKVIPHHQRGEQTAAAYLRQADGVLPHQRLDAGWD